jgi:hypothetical protein
VLNADSFLAVLVRRSAEDDGKLFPDIDVRFQFL